MTNPLSVCHHNISIPGDISDCYILQGPFSCVQELKGLFNFQTEDHTCSKLEIPYPMYDEESNGWTKDHFSTSNAIDNGSK